MTPFLPSRLPQWQSGFDAMLAYAESKGWYRVDTGIVEAHIDWHA